MRFSLLAFNSFKPQGVNLRHMASSVPYDQWSKDDLITRIRALESGLDDEAPPVQSPAMSSPLAASAEATVSIDQKQPPLISSEKRKKPPKPFNFAQYPKRKIALKFSYAGWEYNGLAYQTDPTPLPMVEAVLLKALGDCRSVSVALGSSPTHVWFLTVQADRSRSRV